MPGHFADGTQCWEIRGYYLYAMQLPYTEQDVVNVAAAPYTNEVIQQNQVGPSLFSKFIIGPDLPPAGAVGAPGLLNVRTVAATTAGAIPSREVFPPGGDVMLERLASLLLLAAVGCGSGAVPRAADAGDGGPDEEAARKAVLAAAFDPSSVRFTSVKAMGEMDAGAADHHKVHMLRVQGTWKVQSGRTDQFEYLALAGEKIGDPATLTAGP